ncbi:hypothetical protein ASPTUDRAFT_702707 [Aspergillus tubingensis CBS 134.48]|uniref:DUF1772 domain-containing protein n=1 Tax=Aspergillus tubingensis (strain CBS 134.48) TaxID=767770 RepID=A0A1L9N1D2_ASPTC|nr:hypothetical protein ASPTUDRAFT_702707 [Aspergillus tubingensis CBS 134.48]
MTNNSSLIHATGVISSSFVAGAIFTSSFAGVSTALIDVRESPALAAQRWVHVHRRCHKLCTPLVLFSAACFGWLGVKTQGNRFLAAATACLGIVPFTIIVLKRSEIILYAAAAESNSESDHVEAAMTSWGVWNMVRTGFPMMGGLLAVGMYL